jgi:hypothetical protein
MQRLPLICACVPHYQEGLSEGDVPDKEKQLLKEAVKRVQQTVALVKRQDSAKEDVANGDRMFQDSQVCCLCYIHAYIHTCTRPDSAKEEMANGNRMFQDKPLLQ